MAEPNVATVFSADSPSLNDLPEEILTHILSFLPTITAIQFSLTCRKWRNLCCRLPSLNFPYPSFDATNSTITATARYFVDFINQTLIHRSHNSPPLQKFWLQFDFVDYLYSTHIDSWVRYAILHHVQELELDFYISREFRTSQSALAMSAMRIYYDFPFFFLKNGTVTDLKLIRCLITLPTSVASLGLTRLKSIFLDEVYISDEMLSNLISGCVNLDFLGLENCYGMKDIKICSSKITVLKLNYTYDDDDDDGSLEICCPNLLSLEMIGFQSGNYNFKNISNLVEANVALLHKLEYFGQWSQVVKSLLHVQRLTVQNWWFKLLTSDDDFSKGLTFCNLKHLELKADFAKYDLLGIAAILGISPNLETLILNYHWKIDEVECVSEEVLNKPIKLSMPKLTFVEIRYFKTIEDVARFVALVFDQGPVLEKVILYPPGGGIPATLEKSKLLDFPAISPTIVSWFDEDSGNFSNYGFLV